MPLQIFRYNFTALYLQFKFYHLNSADKLMDRKNQILAKRGTDSRFVVEANLKSLCPKWSRGLILKSQNCVSTKHEYQPSSKMVEYTDFWRSDLNITRVELSFLIQPSIRLRIIPDYLVFSSSEAGSSYSPKFAKNPYAKPTVSTHVYTGK